MVFAKGHIPVYRGKTALTAADLLNDKVLPFFDGHGIRMHRVLTDNGPELCGRQDSQPYELFLHLSDIEHTRTRVRHPQTNGAVERLHQTIPDEFYRVAFRKKLYQTIEEIQADLDAFMEQYNIERTNQGRTPFKTFLEGLELYQKHVYEGLETGEAV